MEKYSITISGVTPLIVNRFHEENEQESTSGIHTRKAKLSPEEDARNRLYMNGSGPYLPAENIRQSIIGAGSRFKIGRKQASYDLAAALFIAPDVLPIKGTWHTDSRAVVIPSTKGRITRHRPMFNEWVIAFDLMLDATLVDEKLVRQVLDAAGAYTGLGDFRPARKGPYGRFQVSSWKKN